MSQDIDTLIDRRKLKRRLSFWRVAAILTIIILAGVLFGRLSPIAIDNYVARISVDGIITEDDATIATLRRIAADDGARALVVRINSPGGTTAGSEDLFHALRRVADQKPVVAVMGTLAASGGYITAIAADHIIARETTITGSIGVIMQYAELSGLFEKIGVNMEEVKSAPLKGEPSIDKPLSDDARTVLQSMIDDSYQWFVGLVSERRGLPLDTVITLADGRPYTGRQAKANGLVDELGGMEEARSWLDTSHEISADLPIVDVDRTARERFLEDFANSIWNGVGGKVAMPLDGMTAVWQPRP